MVSPGIFEWHIKLHGQPIRDSPLRFIVSGGTTYQPLVGVSDDSFTAAFIVGTRIEHPLHGGGIVVEVNSNDKRHKPYKVLFDNAEVDRYNAEQLIVKKDPTDLKTQILALKAAENARHLTAIRANATSGCTTQRASLNKESVDLLIESLLPAVFLQPNVRSPSQTGIARVGGIASKCTEVTSGGDDVDHAIDDADELVDRALPAEERKEDIFKRIHGVCAAKCRAYGEGLASATVQTTASFEVPPHMRCTLEIESAGFDGLTVGICLHGPANQPYTEMAMTKQVHTNNALGKPVDAPLLWIIVAPHTHTHTKKTCRHATSRHRCKPPPPPPPPPFPPPHKQ